MRNPGFSLVCLAMLCGIRCGDGARRAGTAPALEPLGPGDVKVEGEIGRRMDLTMRNNILKIDVDGVFLGHFRNRSSHPPVRDGFVGAGMFLDALVRFAAYGRDPEMIRLKSRVAGALLDSQEADGYIGIFTPEKRMQGWDTHEGGYLILALAGDFQFFGETRSLRGAQKYADLLISKKAGWITGLEDAFLALYRLTGEKRYLDACIRDFGLPEFRGGSVHHSRHVYGFLERCLMQVVLYGIQPDPKLLYKPHVAVEHLVNMDGMDILGTAGLWEHMNTSQEGHDSNGETCATAYVIRLMDALLRVEGNSFYGDIMERSLTNALFAAQSPDGRKLRYFTDYESAKEYYPDDAFCCPNNFRRVVSDLPQFLYYRTRDGLAVNLYGRSRAALTIGGVRVEIGQETDYPSDGEVSVTVNPSSECGFDLFLRIPLWCRNARVSVNGDTAGGAAVAGTFYAIRRNWKKGDCVRLSLPMEWRIVKGRGRQYGKAALMRGPVVFAMNDADNAYLRENMEVSVDLASIGDPVPDGSFRPGGLRCSALARSAKGGRLRKLVFTEFIDPATIKTFFFPSGESRPPVDDEFVARHY